MPTQSDKPVLYEYAVVRYVPRVEREEFINVGLIMMCNRRRLLCRLHPDFERIACFAPCHTKEEISAQLASFNLIASAAREGGPIAMLEPAERFRWLTAVRSSCIQTSRPHPGHTADPEATFDRLFAELVL